MRISLRLAGGALIAALGAWACGGSAGYGTTPTAPTTSTNTPPTTTNQVVVSIVGSSGSAAYNPNPATASSGDTVVWQNKDSRPHHIVLDDGSADLGTLQPGTTSTGLKVNNAATMNYHCTIHPSMTGSINGTATAPPPCTGYYC